MRLSLFAAFLLAPLALGGCDDNPIGPGGARLVGSWATEEIPVNTPAPNGSTTVRYGEDRTYWPNGTFVHTASIVDVTTGRSWVIFARKGNWKASEEVLREVTREAFYAADHLHPPELPVLVPVDPELFEAHYETDDATLLIKPDCPPNALCVLLRPLYRVPTL